jgi:hypothetical protein
VAFQLLPLHCIIILSSSSAGDQPDANAPKIVDRNSKPHNLSSSASHFLTQPTVTRRRVLVVAHIRPPIRPRVPHRPDPLSPSSRPFRPRPPYKYPALSSGPPLAAPRFFCAHFPRSNNTRLFPGQSRLGGKKKPGISGRQREERESPASSKQCLTAR